MSLYSALVFHLFVRELSIKTNNCNVQNFEPRGWIDLSDPEPHPGLSHSKA